MTKDFKNYCLWAAIQHSAAFLVGWLLLDLPFIPLASYAFFIVVHFPNWPLTAVVAGWGLIGYSLLALLAIPFGFWAYFAFVAIIPLHALIGLDLKSRGFEMRVLWLYVSAK